MDDVLMAVAVMGAFVLIAYSPIARGIGDRIRHGRIPPPGSGADEGRVDDLSGEVVALRQALYEAQERLDFHERMLAQAKSRDALPGASARNT